MFTLANVVDTDGHPQELGLGPDVGVELDFFAETLRVECRYCWRGNGQEVAFLCLLHNADSDMEYYAQGLRIPT